MEGNLALTILAHQCSDPGPHEGERIGTLRVTSGHSEPARMQKVSNEGREGQKGGRKREHQTNKLCKAPKKGVGRTGRKDAAHSI